MTNDKSILNYCPNYNKITNFEFLESDLISNKLVSFYQNYIYRLDVANTEDLTRAKSIDKVLSKYIDDYCFRKEMKKALLQIKVKRSATDILKVIIDNIINIFNHYQEYATRNIYISRWI